MTPQEAFESQPLNPTESTTEECIDSLETLFKAYQKDSEFNYQLSVAGSPFNQLKNRLGELEKENALLRENIHSLEELMKRPELELVRENIQLQQDNDLLLINECSARQENKKLEEVLNIIKDLFDFDFAIRFGDNQPMIKITNKRNGQYWELPETTKVCDLLKKVFWNE